MASTYSDLKFELIGTGEQSGTWGVTTNTNIGTAIEEAITGSADVTFASGDVTLTLTNTNATQAARNLRLNCTGTTGGARNLIVPTIEKFYLVNNGCADAITVKNSTGTGVAVPAGKAMLVFNNGTDVVEAISYATALAASGANSDITSLSGLTTALSIAQGGTGATTALAATQNLGVEVGVDVQAYDADLTTIAGLAKTDGNFIVGDGTNWVAESGSTARTSLGLGSIATQAANNVSITGGSITGITDLTVADGGTGRSTLTANNVLLGNGTSAVDFVAPGTSGNVLTSNGTTWTSAAIAAGSGYTMSVFSAPGTWTKPANLVAIKVTVVGGGGGGGGAKGRPPVGGLPPTPISAQAAGGGGGGGGAIAYIQAPAIPGPVAVTRGAGGTGGPAPGTNSSFTSGGAGGTTSFGAFISATGGSGSASGNGGAGGTGTAPGQFTFTGQRGGIGAGSLLGATRETTGLGGSGLLGVGGVPAAAPSNGQAGGIGAGGSGGYSQGPTGQTGGAGGNGYIIVEEFTS